MKISINNKLEFTKKKTNKIKVSLSAHQHPTEDINLKVLYDTLESKGTPKTIDNLIYLSDGLYMNQNGDLVEE